jgi:hypothetical protein
MDLMDHREIEGYLPEFAAGDLDEATRATVASHVDQCGDCRAWLETYETLFAAMPRREEYQHPASEILALCVTRPEEEYEFEGANLDHHLNDCEDCRKDLERVGDAVRAARPSPSSFAHTSPSKLASSWWRVAAAGIVGIGIGSLLIFGTLGVEQPDTLPFEVSDLSSGSDGRGADSAREEISGTEIEGTYLIEAEGSLTISQVRIKDGARVTIHAGDGVAFGNGFQVGPETRVSIGAGPGPSDEVRKDQPS